MLKIYLLKNIKRNKNYTEKNENDIWDRYENFGEINYSQYFRDESKRV